MILPWLARRAGVSDSHAEELWLAACRQAALLTGAEDGSLYWGAALQNLLELLERERWHSCSLFAWRWPFMPGRLPGWPLLARVWLAPMWLMRPLLPLLNWQACTPAQVDRRQ